MSEIKSKLSPLWLMTLTLGCSIPLSSDEFVQNEYLGGVIEAQPFPRRTDILKISGTLRGAPTHPNYARVYGLHVDLSNETNGPLDIPNDPSQVRGVFITTRTSGTGSLRGLRSHALALAGSTAPIDAAAFRATPVSTTSVSRVVQVTSAGVPGLTDGVYLTGSVPSLEATAFRVGINFAEARFTDSAIFMLPSPTSRINWNSGASIGSPSFGVLKLTGRVELGEISDLEARILALEARLATCGCP